MRLIVIIIFFIAVCNASAQPVIWHSSFTGSMTAGYDMAVAADGSVYSVGAFFNSTDFDPAAETEYTMFPAEAPSSFITKLDPSGSLIWTYQIQPVCMKILAADDGNIYIAGNFFGTADFDPGEGVVLGSASNLAGFILKLDADGNFIAFTPTGLNLTDLDIDGDSNLYTTGRAGAGADYDPEGTFILPDAGIYVTRWSLNLDFENAVVFPSSSSNVYDFDITGDRIAISGSVDDQMDFDPSSNDLTETSSSVEDGFVVVIDAALEYVWHKRFGIKLCQPFTVNIDAAGEVCVGGIFNSQGDFDPGTGTISVASNGGFDAFIAMIDVDGELLWANNFGGEDNDMMERITRDGSGNIYGSGSFFGSVDFNPGTGTFVRDAMYQDIFIARFDESGDFDWMRQFAGDATVSTEQLQVDAAGSVYILNTVEMHLYLNPTGDEVGNTFEFSDTGASIVKLTQENCTLNNLWMEVMDVTCEHQGSALAYLYGATAPFTYEWSNGNNGLFMEVSAPGTYTLSITDANGCTADTAVFIDAPAGINGHDFNIYMASGGFSPGEITLITLEFMNSTCALLTPEIRFVPDSLVEVQVVNMPFDMEGDTLVWNNMEVYSEWGHSYAYIHVLVSEEAVPGEELHFHIEILPSADDLDPTDNIKDYHFTVAGEPDPEVMTSMPAGACEEHYVAASEPLTYTVSFQNLDEQSYYSALATVHAGPWLDLSTVNIVGSSHAVYSDPGDGNTINFHFDNAYMYGTSEVPEGGNAYVIYEIMPVEGADNAVSTTYADIYYDGGFAGSTPETFVTIVQEVPLCPLAGCTDTDAMNYNPMATIEDGSCVFCVAEDVNSNGVVDLGDLLYVIDEYGCIGQECDGDVNGDEIVGAQDIILVVAEWGITCP